MPPAARSQPRMPVLDGTAPNSPNDMLSDAPCRCTPTQRSGGRARCGWDHITPSPTAAATARPTCARARQVLVAMPPIMHACVCVCRLQARRDAPRRPTPCCPCGQVLAGLLERQAARGRAYSRVLYVGDGRGDYCPSALLLHGSGSDSGGGSGNASKSGDGGSEAPAAAAAGAAKLGSSSAGAAAPVPCGSGANLVFARVEYPDGVPCSLWVMLQQAHSVHSSDGSGASAGTPHQAAAAAAGQAGAAGEAAAHQGVVAWTTAEQLAALLSAELQLELEQ